MTEEKKLTWIKLMWQNNFINLFIFAVALLIAEIVEKNTFYSQTAFWLSLIIPLSMMAIIIYKGFYQAWRDYKSGKSR